MSNFLRNKSKKVIIAIIVIMTVLTGIPKTENATGPDKAPTITPKEIVAGTGRTSGEVLPGTQLKFDVEDDNLVKKVRYQWNRHLGGTEPAQDITINAQSAKDVIIQVPSDAPKGLLELSVAVYDNSSGENKNKVVWVDIPYYVVSSYSKEIDNVLPEVVEKPDSSILKIGDTIKFRAEDNATGIYCYGYKWVEESKFNPNDYVTGAKFIYGTGDIVFTKEQLPSQTGRYYLQMCLYDGTNNVKGYYGLYTFRNDITPPEITINPDNFPHYVDISEEYTAPNATAYDKSDNVTVNIIPDVTELTNAKNAGAASAIDTPYEIVYTATDRDGNSSTEKRNVYLVDYSKLKEQVKIAEGLVQGDYTDNALWNEVQSLLLSAKNKIDAHEKNDRTQSIQSEIKKNADDLENAIANLRKSKKPVDKTKLDEFLKDHISTDYENWDDVKKPIEEANKKDLQSEFDEIVKEIIDTVLVPKKIDTSALDTIEQNLGKLDEIDFTENSWNTIQTQINNAKDPEKNKGLQSEFDKLVLGELGEDGTRTGGIDLNTLAVKTPSISNIRVNTSNSNSSYAKVGDTITFTFEANTRLDEVQKVTINGVKVSDSIKLTKTDTEGKYEYSFTYTFTGNEENLADGVIKYAFDVVKTIDGKGVIADATASTQIAETTTTITYDTVAPTISFKDSLKNENFVIDENGNAKVSIFMNSTYTNTQNDVNVENGANLVITDTTIGEKFDSNSAKIGTYTISYTATDLAGNSKTITKTISVQDYIDSIEVLDLGAENGTKQIYTYGDEIKLSDIKVKVTYASGETTVKTGTLDSLNLPGVTITPQKLEDANGNKIKLYDGQNENTKQPIIISYPTNGSANKTVEYKIMVNKKTYDMNSIKFEDKTFKYDKASHSIFIDGTLPAGVTVSYDGNGKTNVEENNGYYTVTAKFAGDYEHYEKIPDMTAKLTISPIDVTVTINNAESFYGDDIVSSLSSNAGSSAVTSLILPGDTLGISLKAVTEKGQNGRDLVKGDAQGTYPIIGTWTNKNYNVTFVDGIYKVKPREITVNIGNRESFYGDNLESLAFDSQKDIITGTKYGNDDLQITLTKADGTVVKDGGYAITGTSTNSNYKITFVDGVYTIKPRKVTVIIGGTKTSIYGEEKGSGLTKTLDSASSFANGEGIDDLGISLKVDGTDVGTYDITASASNKNYSVTFQGVNKAYTITQRQITIEIGARNSIYGETLADLKYNTQLDKITSGSIFEKDDLGITLTRENSNKIDQGQYAINGSSSNGNYNVTFTKGTYTISKRPVTVEIGNKEAVYGDAIVDISKNYTVTSTYNPAVIQGDDLGIVLVKDNGNDAGTYTVKVSETSKLNQNYDITYKDNKNTGTYTIKPKSIIDSDVEITLPSPKQGETGIVYDNTEKTAVVALKNGINAVEKGNEVAGTKYDAIYEVVYLVKDANGNFVQLGDNGKPKNAGIYKVRVIVSGQGNYTTVTANGNTLIVESDEFEIEKRKISIKADDKSGAYNSDIVELTWTITSGSIVEGTGKDAEKDTLNIQITTDATKNSAPGGYAIKISASNDNYAISLANGIYSVGAINPTINELDVIIAGEASQNEQTVIEKTYDGAEKTATINAKAGVAGLGQITVKYYNEIGQLVASSDGDKRNPKLDMAVKNVGTYTIKASIAGGSNYNAAEGNNEITVGKLKIKKRDIEVIPEDADSIYKEPISSVVTSNKFKVIGGIEENTSAGIVGTIKELDIQVSVNLQKDDNGNVISPVKAGGYEITAIENPNNKNNNYNITFNKGTYTINPRPIVAGDIIILDPALVGDETQITFNQTAREVRVNFENGINGVEKGKEVAGTSYDATYEVKYLVEDTNGNFVEFTENNGKPVNAGKYKAVVTVTGQGNYTTRVEANGTTTETLTKTSNVFEIKKATPTYTVPEGLKATYGQTLADVRCTVNGNLVNLPTEFTFEAPSSTLVGEANADGNSFTLKYTPSDANNYDVVTGIPVKVVVEKAEQPTPDVTLEGSTYNADNNTYTVKTTDAIPTFKFTNSAMENGNVTYSVQSDNTGTGDVITINNGVITAIHRAGTAKINVTYGETKNYNAKSTQIVLNVVKDGDISLNDFYITEATKVQTYDGTVKKADVQSTLSGIGKITVKYYQSNNSEVKDPISARTYKVVIDVEPGEKYEGITGLEVGTLTIEPKELKKEDLTVTPEVPDYTYSKDQVQKVEIKGKLPGVGNITVKYYDDNGDLVAASDGDKRNPSLPLGVTNAGNYTVKVDTINATNFKNATDLEVMTFEIKKKTITSSDIKVTYPNANEVYNGVAKEIKVELLNGIDADITITYISVGENGNETTLGPNEKPVNEGTYKVIYKVEGKGNYQGTVTDTDFTFQISPKAITSQDVEVNTPALVGDETKLTYTGSAREVTVNFKNGINGVEKGKEVQGTKYDATYEVIYLVKGANGDFTPVPNNGKPVNAGTYKAQVVITGQGNYTTATSNETTLTVESSEFVIEKAEPTNVPDISNVTINANYGQSLDDIKGGLPAGWAFDDNGNTLVGDATDANGKTFNVTYTPADPDNYKQITGETVKVVVAKINQPKPDVTLEGATYDSTNKTYTVKMTDKLPTFKFTNSAMDGGSTDYTVTSDNAGSGDVITIQNGVITSLNRVGTAKITVTYGVTTNYNATSSEITLIVVRDGALTKDNFTITEVTKTQIYSNSPKTVVVEPKDVSDVNGIGNIIIKYYDKDKNLVASSDGANNLPVGPKDAGIYNVVIDVLAGTKYEASTGLEIGTLTINKKAITVTADNKSSEYKNAIETLTFTVPQDALAQGDTKDGLGLVLTTTATNTSAVGSYPITAKQEVNGIAVITNNNYEVTVTQGTYTITEKTITKSDVQVDLPQNAIYNAVAQEPVVSFNNGINATDGVTDATYTIKYLVKDKSGNFVEVTADNGKPVNAGTYKAEIEVKGTGNYKDSITVETDEYQIGKKTPVKTSDRQNSDLIVKEPASGSGKYDGNPKKAEIEPGKINGVDITGLGEIKITYRKLERQPDGTTKILSEGADIPTDAGLYQIFVSLKEGDNYTALKWLYIKTYEIIAKDIVDADVIVTEPTNLDYDGTAKEVTVSFNNGINGVEKGKEVEGTKYDAIYEVKYLMKDANGDFVEVTANNGKPVDAGTYKAEVTIKGQGNYKGDIKITSQEYVIGSNVPTLEDLDVNMPNNLEYDGTQKVATIGPKSGISGLGNITVKYYKVKGEGTDQNGMPNNLEEGTTTAPINVGTYVVKADIAQGSNYASALVVVGKFEITKREITITANAQTMVYGEVTLDQSAYTIEPTNKPVSGTKPALVNGDTANVTLSTVAGNASDITKTDADKHDITINAIIKNGEADVTDNYKITLVNGKLEITAREITITANDQSMVYGEVLLDQNAYTVELTKKPASGTKPALVNGDTANVTLSTVAGNTSNVTKTDADKYDITVNVVIKNGEADVSGNYKITLVDGKLEITAREITITANDQSMVYGEVSLDQNAYTVELTKKPASGTKPALVNGDTANVTLSTVAGNTSNVTKTDADKYDITVNVVIKNGETDVSSNYKITLVDGKLEITAREITITAKPQTMVYGEVLLDQDEYTVELTNKVEGEAKPALVNGDIEAVLLSTVAGNTSDVTTTEDDKYDITLTAKIMNGKIDVTDNYKITLVNGKLEITPKLITDVTITLPADIGFDEQEKVVGVTFAPGINAVESGKEIAGTKYDATYTVVYYEKIGTGVDAKFEPIANNGKPVNVGTYYAVVTVTGIGNYTTVDEVNSKVVLTKESDEYTITPMLITSDDVTITPPDKDNLTYDGTQKVVNVEKNPTNSKKTMDIQISYSWLDKLDENGKPTQLGANEYPINAGTYRAEIAVSGTGNYGGSVSDTITFTISKRAITIISENQTSEYGQTVSLNQNAYKVTLTSSGATENAIATVDTANITLRTEPQTITVAGTYPIKVNYDIKRDNVSVKDNYDVTIKEGTYTITPKQITLDEITVIVPTDAEDLKYNKSEKPIIGVNIKFGENEVLNNNQDYTYDVVYYEEVEDTQGNKIFIKLNGKPIDVGTYKAEVIVTGKGNYTTENTSNGVTTTTITKTSDLYTITKATPTYTVPTGLTATYGETLADVKYTDSEGKEIVGLPKGFTFEQDLTTSVGPANAQGNSFTVKYTPADINNYEEVSNIEVKVVVLKATPTYTVPTGLTAVYGETLADVKYTNSEGTEITGLPEGFAFEQDLTTSVGPANTQGNSFTVKYTPVDTNNFDVVTGITVKVVVAKANQDSPAVTLEGIEYDDTNKIYTVKMTQDAPTFKFTNSAKENGSITYTATPESIITVNGVTGDITLVGASDNVATITVTYGETANYNSSKTEIKLLVIRDNLNKGDFIIPGNIDNKIEVEYDTNSKEVNATPVTNIDFNGTIDKIKYYPVTGIDSEGNKLLGEVLEGAPVNVGTYVVKIDVSQSKKYNSKQDLEVGELVITPIIITNSNKLSYLDYNVKVVVDWDESSVPVSISLKEKYTANGINSDVQFTIKYTDDNNTEYTNMPDAIGIYTAFVKVSGQNLKTSGDEYIELGSFEIKDIGAPKFINRPESDTITVTVDPDGSFDYEYWGDAEDRVDGKDIFKDYTGSVDITTVGGPYTVNYIATDKSGNTATYTLTVYVQDIPPRIYTVSEFNPDFILTEAKSKEYVRTPLKKEMTITWNKGTLTIYKKGLNDTNGEFEYVLSSSEAGRSLNLADTGWYKLVVEYPGTERVVRELRIDTWVPEYSLRNNEGKIVYTIPYQISAIAELKHYEDLESAYITITKGTNKGETIQIMSRGSFNLGEQTYSRLNTALDISLGDKGSLLCRITPTSGQISYKVTAVAKNGNETTTREITIKAPATK